MPHTRTKMTRAQYVRFWQFRMLAAKDTLRALLEDDTTLDAAEDAARQFAWLTQMVRTAQGTARHYGDDAIVWVDEASGICYNGPTTGSYDIAGGR